LRFISTTVFLRLLPRARGEYVSDELRFPFDIRGPVECKLPSQIQLQARVRGSELWIPTQRVTECECDSVMVRFWLGQRKVGYNHDLPSL